MRHGMVNKKLNRTSEHRKALLKNMLNSLIKYEQIKQGLVGSVLNVSGVEEVRAMQKLAVENSRLKIPLIFALDVIHGYKTITPIPLAESASWNLDLIKKYNDLLFYENIMNWTYGVFLIVECNNGIIAINTNYSTKKSNIVLTLLIF